MFRCRLFGNINVCPGPQNLQMATSQATILECHRTKDAYLAYAIRLCLFSDAGDVG